MNDFKTNSTTQIEEPGCPPVKAESPQPCEHRKSLRALGGVTQKRRVLAFVFFLPLFLHPKFVHAQGGESKPAGGAEFSNAQILVHLTLENTVLTQSMVLNALEEEFGVSVAATQGEAPLQLRVKGRNLTASFKNEAGEAVDRQLFLPEATEQQADAVALLAGNVARDEAALLLAQLTKARAVQQEQEQKQSELEADQNAQDEKKLAEKEEKQKAKESGSTDPSEEGEKKEESPPKQSIPVVPFSLAFSGDIATPPQLNQKQAQFGLGAVYMDVGALDGFGASLLLLRNRGRAQSGAGRGVQISGIWLGREEEFHGVSASFIAVTERGGTEGVQAGGIVAIQDGDIHGAQLSMVAAIAKGRIKGGQMSLVTASASGALDGVQLSLVSSFLGGNATGFQGSLVSSITRGNVEGGQVAVAAAFTQHRVEGFQVGLTTIAHDVDGFQFGGVNLVQNELEGSQIGLVNVTLGSPGTQVGLVNIGGEVRRNQIGLVNIARDVKGLAIGPVNFVPGLRTQVVGYGSYSPSEALEGVPDHLLGHVGVKVHSHSFYSELSFGLGPESKECSSDAASGATSCLGGGVEFAPGIAFGARIPLTKQLFLESDLQYQFQKAFSPSNLHQHVIAPRFALGVQVSEHVAPYIGGGPRMNLRAGEGVSPNPEVSFAPQLYGGVQFF